jgi:hypothetical protein
MRCWPFSLAAVAPDDFALETTKEVARFRRARSSDPRPGRLRASGRVVMPCVDHRHWFEGQAEHIRASSAQGASRCGGRRKLLICAWIAAS